MQPSSEGDNAMGCEDEPRNFSISDYWFYLALPSSDHIQLNFFVFFLA